MAAAVFLVFLAMVLLGTAAVRVVADQIGSKTASYTMPDPSVINRLEN
jgi:hypothetical protein